MILVGFIKEYNNIPEANEYSEIVGDIKNDAQIITYVINYLNNGTLVLGWMGYFIDLDDNSLIAPDSYYSDGTYIWPAYLAYYLKKEPNYILNKNFISHILKNRNSIKKIKEKDIEKIEKALLKKLNSIS